MKESKSSKIILVYKTLYGFQKLDVHNKFVGVHLYVVYAVCVRVHCVRDVYPGFTHVIPNNKFLPGVEIVDYLTVGHFETYSNDKFLTC